MREFQGFRGLRVLWLGGVLGFGGSVLYCGFGVLIGFRVLRVLRPDGLEYDLFLRGLLGL